MFLNAFDRQANPAEAERETNPPTPGSPSAKPAGPGEFTQLFGSLDPATPPTSAPSAAASAPEVPKQGSEEVTRIFVRQAAPPAEPPVVRTVPIPAPSPNPQRMRGFSAPGASDSASADGTFTQLFRAVSPGPSPSSPIPPTAKTSSSPAPNPGATELFRALSQDPPLPAERATRRPDVFPEPASTAAPGSVTMWLQKLSEEIAPSQTSEPQATPVAPERAAPAGQGEYTRIISGDALKAVTATPPASAIPAAPAAAPVAKMPAPVGELPKPPAPKLSPPASPAPLSKLQQMMPILLVLNSFLLVVLILVVVFALLRK